MSLASDSAGPFVGHGGYDWHTTLWSDAMGTEVSMDAHGDTAAADVNAWFLGPTSVGGEPMGFPPVHMHHAHIRNGRHACSHPNLDLKHPA